MALDRHAAKIAVKPRSLSWFASNFAEDLVVRAFSLGSWTIATPAVRSKSENHFRLEYLRWKKMTENMAVVRIFN